VSTTPYRKKWASRMSDRERFVNQMHCRPVDRCFNMEFGYWQENFETWPLFVENGITNNGMADRFFSFDVLAHAGGNIWMHPGFPQEVVEETDTRKVIRNHEGLLAEVPKDGHATIPHFIKASIVTPDDWKRAKAERFRLDDPDRRIDVTAVKAAHPADRDYPLAVNCGSMIGKVRDMLTIEGLSYAIYDYPDMVEDMVETCCQLVEHALGQLLGEIDFDCASGWEDICFNHGPLLSLDFFRSVVLPRYKRIGEKLRAAGIDIWYTDCDGDVRPLIPIFLEAGLNTMFPFEVHCSGHPGEVLSEYGEQLRILGGVDKRVLAQGPDAIKAYLQSLVPWVQRGGFIPFCDHRCPPDVKQEYYLYYLDLKEEMFGIQA